MNEGKVWDITTSKRLNEVVHATAGSRAVGEGNGLARNHRQRHAVPRHVQHVLIIYASYVSLLHFSQDLVKNLLKVNPSERLTACQALQHRWLLREGEGLVENDLGPGLQELQVFNARRKLQLKAAIKAVRTSATNHGSDAGAPVPSSRLRCYRPLGIKSTTWNAWQKSFYL